MSVSGEARNTYYYQRQQRKYLQHKARMAFADSATVKHQFMASYRSYGTRHLKVALNRQGTTLSRRHINRIMRSLGLVSKYIHKSYKAHVIGCNESVIKNDLRRDFAPG